MTTTLAPDPVTMPTDDGDDLFHLYCCDENRALCGKDVTDDPITDGDGEPYCAVCMDLIDSVCPICGDAS